MGDFEPDCTRTTMLLRILLPRSPRFNLGALNDGTTVVAARCGTMDTRGLLRPE